MEWILLLLLVPAILVPIVLLWGFAGCQLVFKVEELFDPPQNLVATPHSVTEISLTWISLGTGLQFEVHRARDGEPFEVIGLALTSPFVDPPSTGNPAPLEPGITYNYQVFSVEGDRKLGSNIAQARPAAFHLDFSTVSQSDQGATGDCIVQTIKSATLKNWGTITTIHLRGASAGNLLINSMSISRVARPGTPGNPTPDPYDSDADLVVVGTGIQVLSDSSTPVQVLVPYTIPNPPEDLLISFDISSTQGFVRRALVNGAVAHVRNATQEANVQDRVPNPANPGTPYAVRSNQHHLIEKIEVQ